VAIGFTVMIAVVGAGMATVLAIVPGLLGAIKWASVAYLLWLSWRIATAPATPLAGRSAARPLTLVATLYPVVAGSH
jgi:threonine/homoserine/homoserine lactone efflux protein